MNDPNASRPDFSLYYKGERADIVPFLPENPKSILDVGCGAGTFARTVADKTGGSAWGIEPHPEAAAEAQKNLDKAFACGVEEALPQLPDQTFDLITCLDVLEHLVDPWEVLKQLRSKLTADGVIVASVPNVRHFSAIIQLLVKKDFPQHAWGTFDRTHLRWFTEKSLRRMFEETGYQVERLEGINPWRRKVLFGAVNALLMNQVRDMKYVQFAVVARPKPTPG